MHKPPTESPNGRPPETEPSGIPWWGKLLLGAAVLALVHRLWPESTTKAETTATPNATAVAIASSDRRKQECRDQRPTIEAEYTTLMGKRQFWPAANAVRSCASLLQDPALQQLVRDAEIKSYLADINDPKKPAYDKALAMQSFARDYPDVGGQYAAKAEKLFGDAQRQEAAAEAKRKRSQGVRLGMTPADVIASSWGKPDHINRTTNAYGTHEQWVYGSGNYLYFENGVLTSIQN